MSCTLPDGKEEKRKKGKKGRKEEATNQVPSVDSSFLRRKIWEEKRGGRGGKGEIGHRRGMLGPAFSASTAFFFYMQNTILPKERGKGERKIRLYARNNSHVFPSQARTSREKTKGRKEKRRERKTVDRQLVCGIHPKPREEEGGGGKKKKRGRVGRLQDNLCDHLVSYPRTNLKRRKNWGKEEKKKRDDKKKPFRAPLLLLPSAAEKFAAIKNRERKKQEKEGMGPHVAPDRPLTGADVAAIVVRGKEEGRKGVRKKERDSSKLRRLSHPGDQEERKKREGRKKVRK